MPDRFGWDIDGDFYPMELSFKWGDVALVHEITGLAWEDFEAPVLKAFGRLMNQEENGQAPGLDVIRLTGLLAVAVRRVHPDWARSRVRRLVEDCYFGDTVFLSPDDTGDDAGPPAATAGENESSSASGSGSGSAPRSSRSTRKRSGQQTSPTPPEEPSG